MGCKVSKGKNSKKINHTFELIGFPSFDAFFEDAQRLLENAEEIRSGVIDSRQEGVELSHAYKLDDARYIDVVQVLLWTISAENEGKIMKVDIDVTSDAPFVKLDKSKLTEETYSLYESFSDYLETIMKAPETLAEIVEKLDEMSHKGAEMIKNGKEEIQNSDMDVVRKAKAISQLGKNVSKLGAELTKCRSLQEAVIEAKEDLKDLIPKFKELVSEADKVGAKAHEEHLYTPGKIFERFYDVLRPGEKKPKRKRVKKEGDSDSNYSYSSESGVESGSEEEDEDEEGKDDKEKKKKKGKKSKKDKKNKKEKEKEIEKISKDKKDKIEPEKKESEEKVHKVEVKTEVKYKIETKEVGHVRYSDRLTTDDIWVQAKTEDTALRVPSSYIGSKTLSKIDITTNRSHVSKGNITSIVQTKSKGTLGV